MFRFVKDIRFRVNLETRIWQPKSSGDLTDTDDRRQSVIGGLQRLFPEFRAERNTIFVQDVAQSLGHADGASEKNHFPTCAMRLPNNLSHVFDTAVKSFDRLSPYKKG